ncbi:MAG: hypothetical protein Q8N51_16580 [Gammaproteobacteria bacterium]|nr:hypothetical protein [Gammaproteobacteria bacterium]
MRAILNLVLAEKVIITWLANANLADTRTFSISGIDGSGSMSWVTANNWISAMDSENCLGLSDWRPLI